MTNRLSVFVASSLVLASLGACARSEPDQPPAENAAAEANASAPLTPTASDLSMPAGAGAGSANAVADTAPAAAAPAGNTDADVPPPAPVDHQVLEDASATGMTARSSRGDRPTDDAGAAGQTETK